MVFFVNGFWGFPTLACCGGQKKHWTDEWAETVLSQFGQTRAIFLDGSSDATGTYGGLSALPQTLSSKIRFRNGKKTAIRLQKILATVLIPAESFFFVTSSMGASFARGFWNVLSGTFSNQLVFWIDIDAFQAAGCGLVKEAEMQVCSLNQHWESWFIGGNPVKEVPLIAMDSTRSLMTGHHPSNLSPGFLPHFPAEKHEELILEFPTKNLPV